MSDLNLKGALTYYSNKLKSYIVEKITKVESDISTLDSKVDADKIELEDKIQINSDAIVQNSTDIQTNTDGLTTIDSRIVTLQADLDAKPTGSVGQIINTNNVETFTFNTILAGETVEILNDGDSSDYIIDCYTQENDGPEVVREILDLTSANAAALQYDDKYITLTPTGFKPKETVTIAFSEYYTGTNIVIYTSDLIPSEIQDSVTGINLMIEV